MSKFHLAEWDDKRDFKTFLRWRNSLDWRLLVSARRRTVTAETYRKEISLCLNKQWKHPRVIVSDNGKPVGVAFGYLYAKSDGVITLAIYIERKYRKGSAFAEVAAKYCEEIFSQLGVYKICCDVYAYNTRAKALLPRLGFSLEGVLKKQRKAGSRRHDMLKYALFQDQEKNPLYRRLAKT